MDGFYLLNRMVTSGDVFIKDYQAPRVYEYDYSKGVPLEVGPPIRLLYKYKSNRKTDYVSGIHSFPVISGRFEQVLSEAGAEHLEFHAAQLVCTKTGEVDDSYWFLNILHNVPCLDRQRSEYETFGSTQEITYVTKFVIEPDELRGREIARIAEFREAILISSRVRRSIEEAGLTGVSFQDLS